MNEEIVKHTFEPVYNKESRILILGTFPSVKSREQSFYYGHPRNRFWNIIAALTDADIPKTIDEKKELLLKNNIALWDVISECTICGSSDSSIKNVVPNDINALVSHSNITRIIANGNKAYELYQKYFFIADVEVVKLPSTSPANAAYSVDRLTEEWRKEWNI